MQPKGTTPRDITVIRYVSLVAATVGAMYGEYELAVQTGMDPRVAWAYPVALDAYAYVAFRTGKRRDVGFALMLMGLSQAMTHLLSAHIIPMHWGVIVMVWALILPAVTYLTHNLGHSTRVAGPAAEVTPELEVPTAPIELAAPIEAPPAVELAAPRKRWALADAVAHIEAHAHMSRDELAAQMQISTRRVNMILKQMSPATA